MFRALIADDHEIVRRGIRAVVEAEPNFEVCGEAIDGYDAIAMALSERPDLLILDVSLPMLNGVVVTRRIRCELPHTQVLLFTMIDDEQTVNAGLAAGARGYVLKTDRDSHLAAALRSLAANRPYFSPAVSDQILDGAINGRKKSLIESFSVRELEVGQLIAEGASNKMIARRLGIGVKTVETHRAAVMRKAGVRSAAEFVRFAIRNHIIRP